MSSQIVIDPERELQSGIVFVKYRWRYRRRHAVAYSGREAVGVETGDCEERQAHLLIYKVKSGNFCITERVNFSKVLGVLAGPSRIVLRLPDSDLKFRTKRVSENEAWMKTCALLNAFPNYVIPRPPEAHRSLLRPELASLSAQYCEMYNAHEAWAMHVLSSNVAEAWDIVGLRVVTIGKDNKLNVIHLTTGFNHLKVSRYDILRCGFWGSMIFLEIHVGLRGMLWMDCFQDQVKDVRDKIHNFAFYGPEARMSPLPQFPSFFADLPFSPRCYFDKPHRSRSTSQSSESSDRSGDALSSSLQPEGAAGPWVNLTNHPSFMPRKLTSPSAKYLSQRPTDHTTQELEIVHREGKRRSILLQPHNPGNDATTGSSPPEGYTEPVATNNRVSISSLTADKPADYCTPIAHSDEYIIMHSANHTTVDLTTS